MLLFQAIDRVRGGPDPLDGVLEVILACGIKEKALLRECVQDLGCSVTPPRCTQLELVGIIVLAAVYDSEWSESSDDFVPKLVVVRLFSRYRPIRRQDYNVVSMGSEGDRCEEAKLSGILIVIEEGARPTTPNNH